MHCEKCGSADTEVVKCGDCGQKSCVKCSNCGFASCTDKYCAAIAIKRKIKILKWAVVIIVLIMIGTIPFVYSTFKANKTKKPPVPTTKPTTAVIPAATQKPVATKNPVPTKTPLATKPPVAVPTKNVENPEGFFKNAAIFEKAILKVLGSSKGIKFKKNGKTRNGMDHDEYIKWAFGQLKWDVNSSVKKLSTLGTKITNQKDLKPGDVLFFSLKKNDSPNYMGIYKGNGKFGCIIPKKGKGFTIGPLSYPFFRDRYMYGRRIYPVAMPK